MKAIETKYKGYRFRSRLEARWAVFFDAMDEVWEYEKEGYDLNGIYYLPDFWLPRLNCFIEVKGEAPTFEEIRKVDLLSDLTEKAAALFYGLPSEHWGKLFCWDMKEDSGGSSIWDVMLANNEYGELAFLIDFDASSRTLYASMNFDREIKLGSGCVKADIALERAKQARFEHGENPGNRF